MSAGVVGSEEESSSSTSAPTQPWWEGIARARSRIHSLSAILSAIPSDCSSPSPISVAVDALADSDRPAKALLDSPDVSAAVSSVISAPESGAGDNPLCQWLYETFQSGDPDLLLVVLRYVPLLAGTYLSRVVSSSSSPSEDEPLAGFEAVLLSLYAAETKSRAGKPLLVNVPDLSFPSLYHSPRYPPPTSSKSWSSSSSSSLASQSAGTTTAAIGVLSQPLEPQVAVKSTKRAVIVGVALDWYYRKIFLMPAESKVEFCEFVIGWAGQNCPCANEFDNEDLTVVSFDSAYSSSALERGGSGCSEAAAEEVELPKEIGKMSLKQDESFSSCNGDAITTTDAAGVSSSSSFYCPKKNERGARIPLPWELQQPVVRILGHCLLAPLNSQEVKGVAATAVRCLYARAVHDLFPQAILATRSLIQLDRSARMSSANVKSNVNTPTKPKKPEILLVSK